MQGKFSDDQIDPYANVAGTALNAIKEKAQQERKSSKGDSNKEARQQQKKMREQEKEILKLRQELSVVKKEKVEKEKSESQVAKDSET